jgi:hypothetical protein
MSSSPVVLTAAALEVVAYEYNTSLGTRGQLDRPHATLAAQLLSDPRLDSSACAFWARYLWIGAVLQGVVVDATPSICIQVISRLAPSVGHRTAGDSKLAEELSAEGTTSDFISPIVFRYLHTKGASHIGSSVAVLICVLLLIEHHRLLVRNGGDRSSAILDYLRAIDLLKVDEAEDMQCSAAAAAFAAVTEIVTCSSLKESGKGVLGRVAHTSATALIAASRSATRSWCICNLVTHIARLQHNIVSEATEVAEALLLVPDIIVASDSRASTESDGGAGDGELSTTLDAVQSPGDASTRNGVLQALLFYLIDIFPACGALRCSIGMQRAAQSCLEAVASLCRLPAAAAVIEPDLPALLAMYVCWWCRCLPYLRNNWALLLARCAGGFRSSVMPAFF